MKLSEYCMLPEGDRIKMSKHMNFHELLDGNKFEGTTQTTQQGEKTKKLILRIIKWGEGNRRRRAQFDFLLSDEFKEDLHKAVVIDTLANTSAGISRVEKKEANELWNKYAMNNRHTWQSSIDAKGVTRKF
jgi:hypothetical protein